MAKTQYGTDFITGLNVGTVPHKIAPNELQESVNGWTDQEGAWRVAKSPERLYSGYVGISAFAAGRMGGADHLVWTDDDKLYDNGVSQGALTEGASMKIVALDDKFLILGGSKNYIYDGDHVREQRTWQPERMNVNMNQWTPSDQTDVGGLTITATNPGVVTMAAHELETGDWVYFKDLVEMTELNDRKFLVTNLTASTFSINEDTINYTPETTGTGSYNRKMGLVGVYKWYITCTVELADGRVLESRPRGLRSAPPGDDYDSWEAEEFTLVATDNVRWQMGSSDSSMVWWNYNSADLFSITGTRGTDYFPGIRIYRTKADGTDFYLEREWRHGDANFFYQAGGTSGVYYPKHTETLSGAFFGMPDRELGAVYTATTTDHSNPPDALIATTVGQRLFINDVDNPNRYWWSHLDGIEYYNPLGWNTIPDTITGMATLGDKLVIWSQDRLFIDYFTGGLPDLKEVTTDTGSATGIMATTDDGVLLLEEDGLWVFNGARVDKISRRGFETIDTPKSICATGDIVYMSGEYEAYVVRQRDGGMVWHGATSTYHMSDTTGGKLYGASDHDIAQLFIGAEHGGSLKTAAFSAGKDVQIDRVILDIEGTTVPTVWVNGNRQSDDIPHCATGTDEGGARRRIRIPIPQLSNHVFSVSIATTGGLTVYGVWVEAVS